MMENNLFWRMQRGETEPGTSSKTFGRRIVEFDVAAGELTAELTVSSDFLNPAGFIQGGVLVALLDEVLGPTLSMQLQENEFAPFLNINTNFLRPLPAGPITGKGRIVRKGRTIAYLEGQLISDTGRLAATCTAVANISVATI